MTHRPHEFAIASSDDRRLAVALIGEDSVTGVEVTPAGLAVRASDYGAFTRAFARIAVREGVRVRQLRPSDESLESVFSYLIAQ
jgi:ABC-2 type transport system ATP-binding protein